MSVVSSTFILNARNVDLTTTSFRLRISKIGGSVFGSCQPVTITMRTNWLLDAIAMLQILVVSLMILPVQLEAPVATAASSVIAEMQSQRPTVAAVAIVNNSNNVVIIDDNGSLINLSKQSNSTHSLPALDEDRRYRRRLKSSSLPEFSAPIGNVTAVLGRDTRLICTVEHLGQYQVAWLKEETKTIISIDTNIIITNYRIFLIPDEEERKWVLHIKDVQESDRGFYQCQVNTSPMRSTSGYLEVVVPPTIVESQTSQVAEVAEHSNVSIQCRANGHPRPSISWRREDGLPIKLNGYLNLSDNSDSTFPSALGATSVAQQSPTGSSLQPMISHLNDIKSDRLTFYHVDRSMGGVYVCSASNGIPTQATKRIPLYVKFAPRTSVPSKYISVSLGDQLEIDCLIEAYPKANSYWSKTSAPSTPQAYRLETGRWSQQKSLYDAMPPSDGSSGATSERWKHIELEQESNGSQENLSTSLLFDDLEGGATIRPKRKFMTKSTTHRLPSEQYIEHPHNRIQLRRQIDRHLVEGELPSKLPQQRTQTVITSYSGPSSPSTTAPDSKAYVTVKQATINLYTFKLKMIIARMQADDYGQYYCISTNSLGTSESMVIVTKADKTERNRSPQLKEYPTVMDNNYQNEGPNSKSYNQQQQARQNSAGNRVIYDTNYLQAIKTRQNNAVSSSKLQQKLKLRQYSERNTGFILKPTLLIVFALVVSNYLILNILRINL